MYYVDIGFLFSRFHGFKKEGMGLGKGTREEKAKKLKTFLFL